MLDAMISRVRRAIWHTWAAEARLRPAEPATAVPPLRHAGRFPLLPAARNVRRGAPGPPARPPAQAIS